MRTFKSEALSEYKSEFAQAEIRSGWQMGDSGKGLLAQVVDEPVFDGRVPNSPRAERQARTQRPVRLLLTGTYA
jgi:hypothetical protein